MKGKLSIIIPAYNEEDSILSVLNDIKKVLEKTDIFYEIIVVNDGSTDNTKTLLESKIESNIILLNHPYKKGYGFSLKDGVKKAQGDFVLFIDADGQQYPEDILELIKYTDEYDMIVGARTNITSLPRAAAKKILSLFANYLADYKIPDLNSGFRAVRKNIVMQFIHLLPDSFSFSSTLTLACIKENCSLKYVPIKEKFRKTGKSTINPIKDTARFMMLILRLTVLFSPFRVFLPISLTLFVLSLISLSYDLWHLNITDVTILLFLSSIMIFFFGLLADQVAAIRRRIG